MKVFQEQQVLCPLCLSPSARSFSINAVFKREYFRCAGCALVFVPRKFHLSVQEQKGRYDLHRNDPGDQAYCQFLSKLITPLLGHLKPGAEGLDFGCGPGPAIAGILEKEGMRVQNYDPFYFPSQELLEKRYDFITCTEVIEHFDDPRRDFMKLKGLLKGEGSILAVMTEVWREDKEFANWWYQNDPCHVSFYSESTLHWISQWLGLELHRPHRNVAFFKSASSNCCS